MTEPEKEKKKQIVRLPIEIEVNDDISKKRFVFQKFSKKSIRES